MGYKNLALVTLLVAIMVGLSISSAHAQSLENPNSDYTTIWEKRDLGWTTYATSSHTVNITKQYNSTSDEEMGRWMKFSHNFSLLNTWNLTLAAGTILPVNLTISYPKNVKPGENATIYVGVKSLPGAVFMNLTGYHELELENSFYSYVNASTGFNGTSNWFSNMTYEEFYYKMYLHVLNQYLMNWLLEMNTPIGYFTKDYNNQTVHIGTFNMTLSLEFNDTMDENSSMGLNLTNSMDVSMNFDVTITANTSVIGDVNITGTALSNKEHETLIWNREGEQNVTVPISSNAAANDTVNVDVQLKYVVHEFKVKFSNISMIVNTNESEIENTTGNFVNGTSHNERLQEKIEDGLNNVIDNYLNGKMPLMCKVTGTKLREGHHNRDHNRGHNRDHNGGLALESFNSGSFLLEAESGNTIESTSPYNELVTLQQQIEITVGTEQTGNNGGNIGGSIGGLLSGNNLTLIISGTLVVLIIASYLLVRRNGKG